MVLNQSYQTCNPIAPQKTKAVNTNPVAIHDEIVVEENPNLYSAREAGVFRRSKYKQSNVL
jgi:hypothetical protein